MARIPKRTFNLPKGRIGDYIIKERRGTPYISGRPIRNKVKQTPALKNSKSLFGFFGKLTTELHSDPKIRGMWEASDVPGENSRNKIMSLNYKLIPDDRDLTNLRLSPFDQLFHAQVTETVWGNKKVTVTFSIFEGIPKHSGYIVVSAHGVVRYYGFKAVGYESKYLIERTSSAPVDYRKGEQHTFTLEYDSDYTTSYNNRQFCFTLILENRDGIAIDCSKNIIF